METKQKSSHGFSVTENYSNETRIKTRENTGFYIPVFLRVMKYNSIKKPAHKNRFFKF